MAPSRLGAWSPLWGGAGWPWTSLDGSTQNRHPTSGSARRLGPRATLCEPRKSRKPGLRNGCTTAAVYLCKSRILHASNPVRTRRSVPRTARALLGEGESCRTPLRSCAHGMADLCFGDGCLPKSCKHRMLEFGELQGRSDRSRETSRSRKGEARCPGGRVSGVLQIRTVLSR